MKRLFTFLIALLTTMTLMAQEELTTAQAKGLIKATSKKHVTVHDPSVVWEPGSKRYYIFGSHKAGGYTTNMQSWSSANPTWSGTNANSFITPAVKKVTKGGAEVDFPQFNAMEWSARTDAGYNIDGNMWAPDVLWNEKMQKWCMYLSINGDAWHSSIILLTSDKITGPYRYQGPIVICGFQDQGHSYKGTDLELALGQTLSSLPSRYNVGDGWGRRWPHTIDPAVFYDEEGQLRMIYGSWSGGIWELELDEETGLRDYDVAYPSTGGSTDGVTSDPYFGKKIAGGYYVSGEGAYIEYVGGYYYLFVSYGFFDSVGGYEMRVFRSKNPDGPFVDAAGKSAIYDKYVMNYGKGGDTRGVKILGPYDKWGDMTQGELSQGHNSVIAAPDGLTYLVYHTRFNNGTEGHHVAVHQLFQTKNGWLVAAPFEYNGEKLTDGDIQSRQLFTPSQIAGTYQLLRHKYGMDYKNQEVVTPVEIELTEDGKIRGAFTGSWSIEEGTSYVRIVLAGVTYNGVIIEQQMDGTTTKTISFSALATSGMNIWGYKMHPKYVLATQLNNQVLPSLYNNKEISSDIDLYGGVQLGLESLVFTWNSNTPSVISNYGKYNPAGLTEDVPVTLTARAETPGYFWQQTYNVKATPDTITSDGWKAGMMAHYGFDDDGLTNTFNSTQQAQLLKNGTATAPTLTENEPMRTQKTVNLGFGANGNESYVEMPNPLLGASLAEGVTVAFWLKRSDDNLWDALFGFKNGEARLYMTGNAYVGYNSGAGDYIDIDHPNNKPTSNLSTGRWQFVVLTITDSAIRLYVDGSAKTFKNIAGTMGGKNITSFYGNDYSQLLALLTQCTTFCLGNGSFWGSPEASFDDVILYNRALEQYEVKQLTTMASRVYDFRSQSPDGITTLIAPFTMQGCNDTYDLQGRRIISGKRGLYIRNGKKVFVK